MLGRCAELIGNLRDWAGRGRRNRRGAALFATLLVAVLVSAGRVEAQGVAGRCFCDEQGGIAVSQLIRAVNTALGRIACPDLPSQSAASPAGLCFCDGGTIPIAQLIRAVRIALGLQTCPIAAFIGPGGGTIKVDDERSPLAGIKINVPAGAVTGATITLSARTVGDVPLPAGLVGLGFGFELASDEAPSSDIEICFPVLSSERRNDHILSGLFFDATESRWQVALPNTVGADVFTVRTRQLGIWRPGVTLVRQADNELLIESVLKIQGPDTFAQFGAGVTSFFQPHIDQITNIGTWTRCSAVAALTAALRSARDQARTIDLSNIAPQCGSCEVSSEMLKDEALELARVKISSQVTDATISLLDLDFAAESTAQLLAFAYYDNRISQLTCDYDCFLDANPAGFWLNVGTVYAAEFAVAAAEYVATQIPCQ